jgi:hypothetical protein
VATSPRAAKATASTIGSVPAEYYELFAELPASVRHIGPHPLQTAIRAYLDVEHVPEEERRSARPISVSASVVSHIRIMYIMVNYR